jgi:hypothetical protein
MELRSEVQHILSTKKPGDTFTLDEVVLMTTEITNLLTVAGLDVRTSVELMHRYRDANWYAGYDSGYKRGTDENA